MTNTNYEVTKRAEGGTLAEVCVISENTHTVLILENNLAFCCVGNVDLQLQVMWDSKSFFSDNFGTEIWLSEVGLQDFFQDSKLLPWVRWDSKIFVEAFQLCVRWDSKTVVGKTRYIASEVGLQDLLCGIRSQTPNAAWGGTPRSLLGSITCSYSNCEWGGTPRSPLGGNRHNRVWGGTPRPPLWYPRYNWSQVGLQDLPCGNTVLSYVKWDSKTIAGTSLFSIVCEVGLRGRRWIQLFHSKTDRENFAESFTLNLFQPYLTLSPG